MASQSAPHILIVEARFYDDMSDALLVGATAALEAAGATWETITVPGCLEIPPAVAMALDATDIFIVSPPRRLPASSNELDVRVEVSKKRFMIVRPRKRSLFLSGRRFCST